MLSDSKRWRHLSTAKALMYSCRQFYAQQPVGLSPEYVLFSDTVEPWLAWNQEVTWQHRGCSTAGTTH